MTDQDGSATIDRWVRSAGYADDPAPVREQRLQLLRDFCAYVEQSPDELIERCLTTTESGERKIRAKQRRLVNEAIDAFITSTGRAGHEAVVAGNALRGFFIHNGVFMQGVPSVG